MSAEVILGFRMSVLEITTSFYRAYSETVFHFFIPSFCIFKLGNCSSWSLVQYSFLIFDVDRKKKPHCIALLGMATTLLPKHSVKQVAMWTLKTKKGRPRSWQHLLGDTMILWNAWQNTGLTFMQQTRLVINGDHRDVSLNCFIWVVPVSIVSTTWIFIAVHIGPIDGWNCL